MTPEELEAIQHFIGIRQYLGYLSNEQLYQHLNKYHQWLCNMSEHIDQQAASLDEAEALARKNVELMNGHLARIDELESQILHQTEISACRIEERERLRAQVAALQEIAVEERARYLEDFIHEFDPAENRSLEAHRRLSEEHPEAFR